MKPLTKKLFRDLWRIRGQAFAIACVIAGGVATLVMSLGVLRSLEETQRAYYERYRFADVFAAAKRAPEALMRDIAAIDGVALAEDRIVENVILDMPDMAQPVRGQVISAEPGAEAHLNALVVREGRRLDREDPDEVLLHESFAEGHDLHPGDSLTANMNGRRRTLEIVGIVLSPEYVYAIGPGEIVPDSRRYGVMWMGREALEAAFDLDGAFNSVTLTVSREASVPAVINRLDRLLEPYGGTGAIAREDQLSHAFLESEMDQMGNLTAIVPPIFLGVAAFLLNIVLSRLIQTEREQIGLLKAVGYSSLQVGWHYAKFVGLITILGVVIGWGAGYWMGRSITGLYTEFFRFPFLYYIVDPNVFGIGALVSFAAAGLGTFVAVKRTVRISPAVAMAPPPPTAYRINVAERLGLARFLSPPGRMVLRHIFRWPLRAGLTVIGIAMSVAILIASLFFVGAVDEMMEIYFAETARQDMTLRFVEARPGKVRYEVERLPGVMTVETLRTVPAKLRHGHREERIGIEGLAEGAELSRLVNVNREVVAVPPYGIVLSNKLADRLDARLGDRVTVEVLERRRPEVAMPVSRIVQQYVGLAAYMERDVLNRVMRDGPLVSGAHILVDPVQEAALYERLKEMPFLLSLSVRRAAYETFRDMMQEHLYTMIFFYVGFAGLIAVGVVYNSARISLSERGRELASMRVLGFTKREVALILTGELATLTIVALPVGCILGYLLVALVITLFETDLYTIPFIITRETYGFSVLVVFVAAVFSAALVVRKVAGLDLIAVLKTRE